jgi:soluble lytic murein transglycosylase-like protein
MASIINSNKKYCVYLACILLAWTSPASAVFLCTDEWGGSYMLDQVLKPGLANLKCTSANASNVQIGAARGVKKINSAALALGLAQPSELLPSGNLSLTVISSTARSSTARLSKSSGPLDSMINEIAYQYGHDANLLKAIIHVESRFNANAVSPKGAIGLMQMMPTTGSSVGVKEPKRALFDPQTNINAGAKYLRILMDKFSDRPELAIAAYNAGEGAVIRYNRNIPPYPETQSYVRQVLAQYSLYQKQ